MMNMKRLEDALLRRAQLRAVDLGKLTDLQRSGHIMDLANNSSELSAMERALPHKDKWMVRVSLDEPGRLFVQDEQEVKS